MAALASAWSPHRLRAMSANSSISLLRPLFRIERALQMRMTVAPCLSLAYGGQSLPCQAAVGSMPAGRSAVPGRWRRQLLDAERRVLDGRSPNQSTSNAPKKSAFARRGEIVLLEFALQGFAGHVAWKSLHDHDLTHSLELGANALVDPSREFHAVGLDALAQGDGRDRRLAPMRMR